MVKIIFPFIMMMLLAAQPRLSLEFGSLGIVMYIFNHKVCGRQPIAGGDFKLLEKLIYFYVSSFLVCQGHAFVVLNLCCVHVAMFGNAFQGY